MTNAQDQIQNTVINIVSKHVNIPHNDLDLNAKLIEDLNCSILNLKAILLEIGIYLEPPDHRIETTNDLINYMSDQKDPCKKRGDKDALNDYYGDVYDMPYVKRDQKEIVIKILRDVLNIKDLKISDDQYIKDLPGADDREIQQKIINELEEEFDIVLIGKGDTIGLLESFDLQDFRCHSINQIVDFLHPYIIL